MKALSELPLNKDGSAYHIHLNPEDIVDKIILVGDPGRVSMVSAKFDRIIKKTENREIVTHIGISQNMPIMVMSTGMGVDNIDICINELNFLANYNFSTGMMKKDLRKLHFIRVGTCGAFQPDILLGAYVASEYAVGIDGILYYYDIDHVIDDLMTRQFIRQMKWSKKLPYPYVVQSSQLLLSRLDAHFIKAITVTTPSFYGGQGREVTLPLTYPNITKHLEEMRFSGGKRLGNYEMETSALYGLCAAMGHEALTICLVIANRYHQSANFEYHDAMDKLIEKALNIIRK